MAIILTPILKSKTNQSSEAGSKNPKVTFVLPGEEIKSVIEQLNNKPSDQQSINAVVKVLLSSDTEEAKLCEWLREFIDNIFFLDKENEKITSALLRMNWVGMSEDFIQLYQELILNLVSAHPFYLKPVLAMIIKIFLSDMEQEGDIMEAELVSFKKAHTLLQNILKLVPSSPHTLCTMLSDKFPYMKRSAHTTNCYILNILELIKYLPSKSYFLLECIIDKLLHIDVYCSKEIIEQYELEREEKLTMFPMDEMQEQKDASPQIMAFPLAHNLDVQMNCLFKFIESTCHSIETDELNWDTTKKLYKELLTIFDKIILPTHECCHIQFLLFYICSLRQELAEGFLDYLWKKVQNFSVAPVIRQMAAFYVGSLLARAMYINITTVMACFDLMCNWIHRYIDCQGGNSSHDMAMHGTFHSVCQAVFYIFAFRHQELIDMKDSHKYLRSLNFDRIVTCKLNPLKFCQRTIVQNFANVARHYQIAYCYPVIERNNRSLVCSFAESTAETVSGAMVKTFFPFDPYVLTLSQHWVDAIYRIYDSHVDETEEVMEQEESPQDSELSASNSMLFTYGESPGFKTELSQLPIR